MTEHGQPLESSLRQSWPGFLDKLDAEPTAAFEDFYRYAMKLMTGLPNGPLRGIPRENWMDLAHEVILHCAKENFRVLRRYRDDGHSFSAWLFFVARNKVADNQRSERRLRAMIEPRSLEAMLASSPDPRPTADRERRAADLLDVVARCLRRLDEACRLLIEGAADGLKPRDLARLMLWPPSTNKKVSDTLRACRRRLVRLLKEEGVDLDEHAVRGMTQARPGRLAGEGQESISATRREPRPMD